MKKFLSLLVLPLALGLVGCRDDKPGTPAASVANADTTLSIKAGSELKDIEPLLPKIKAATGVSIKMEYSGSLEAVEQLQAGAAVDAVWLANNRYAMLVPDAKRRILASERTMLTPIVLGLKESKARELGWADNGKVTWKDIADAANAGRFTFGMTNPASSNTGFSALLGLASALSGKGDALEESDVDSKRLAAFFKAQRLTAGSSGWLADAYLKEQGRVDGIVNYASSLLLLNRNPELKEKLVLIYPQDGLVTADYPIMLVNADKRDAYDKLVAYLRGAEFQQAMATSTLRRPINPDVQVAGLAPQPAVAELAFPAKLAVVDAILQSFDDYLRLPTDSTFVLDTSGSMSGSRIQSLKLAMAGLTGTDTSISGRFAKFRNRERISMLGFSDVINSNVSFSMGGDAQANTKTVSAIEAYIKTLTASGGTAIFSATRQAYMDAAARRRKEPSRFYSIVVLTDGENASGLSVAEFTRWYEALPAADQGIKIFPVLFGEARSTELATLADLSGGRVFDSRKSSLPVIFKEIRGYQ